MEKDQIIILENRGLISITGDDAKEYLQNIITNDINKVSEINSIFAALLSPQGKYLFDFFVIKDSEGYLIDCDGKSVKELVVNLSKYKIRSKVEIKDLSSNYVVGVMNFDNFKIIQKELGNPKHLKCENRGIDLVSFEEQIFIPIHYRPADKKGA